MKLKLSIIYLVLSTSISGRQIQEGGKAVG